MEDCEKRHICLSIVVGSETGSIGVILTSLETLCNFFDLNEKTVKIVIPIILDELLRNAIKHGNRDDKSKDIKVEIYLDNDEFKLAIEDKGDGFDYSKYLEKDINIARFAGSGRGLLMVMSYVERISFNAKGNRVEIELTTHS